VLCGRYVGMRGTSMRFKFWEVVVQEMSLDLYPA
jgi:hypothetical protein